jgi:ABC-2 type transport system ATP-binding protein
MKAAVCLALVTLLAACRADQVGPTTPPDVRTVVARADADAGPPSEYPFGPDTYRYSGPFAGAPVPPLVCDPARTGAAEYNGYLVSTVDGTSLDARVQLPAGAGPFPLVALIHGYAGSKSGSGDIAAMLLEDGFAVLRYSTRGFGDSWGQVNLADLNLEIADLRSMIGRVVDDPNCAINPAKVAITGASYGGGHSWLSLVQPQFTSPLGTNITIAAVAPIAPWTDLFYSLVPNGRENESINGFGGMKLSFVNGLYASGIRRNPDRPYPNYPDYFIAWHAWLNATEPSDVDPIWLQIRDGVAGYRSIYWQQQFWNNTVHNRVPVFQVQGYTDDLFPLPEAKRMLLAINSVAPGYPITSYFGDIGHPRASNKPEEMDYVLGLIRPWLRSILINNTVPASKIYAARTTRRSEPFSGDVLTVDDWSQLSSRTVSKNFDGPPRPLVNPATFAYSGATWDPFVMEGAEMLKPYAEAPPAPVIVPTSYASFYASPSDFGETTLLISGKPTVTIDGFVVGHRVQLDVRLIDESTPGSDYMITRGTYTLVTGRPGQRTHQKIEIPTYGNRWRVEAGHRIRLEISNVDAPYITPSREPSTTTITGVTLQLPLQ